MADSVSPDSYNSGGLLLHLRGHVLLFDKRPAPAYDASAGMRLLGTAIGIEALRLVAIRWLRPGMPLIILIPLFLICVLLLVRFVAGLRLRQIGLYRWREWTPVEKSYFIQV